MDGAAPYGWWVEDGGAGGGWRLRGSAMRVMAWQMAQRMDWAPGGSCSGVWQFEQFTSINMTMVIGEDQKKLMEFERERESERCEVNRRFRKMEMGRGGENMNL